MLGGGGGERRYLTFSPSLLRGCPRCIKWRVSWAQEGHGGSNNSQKWKAQCQTYLGRLGSLCKILGWVLDLQSFLPSWPHPPLTPRGASVLNPTLWTAENWTCSTSQGEPEAKQSLKPTSPELPVKRGASCISFYLLYYFTLITGMVTSSARFILTMGQRSKKRWLFLCCPRA